MLVGSRSLTPRTVFLQLGGRDWALALHAASFVERVYVLDSAAPPPRGQRLPYRLARFAAPLRLHVAALK